MSTFAQNVVPLQLIEESMKIVADDKIPYIREKLALLADEVVYRNGADISAADVRDADALVVRTRTRCDERLLAGSRVQFIATATIGFDHIDTDYLQRAGISWTNCPGCNAGSVAQYVECSLLLLEREQGFLLRGATIGVVGFGHVGKKVAAVAKRLGMNVLVCDPPLSPEGCVPFNVIEQMADVITFHVPLTYEGPYATCHMADEAFFQRLPRVPYIINTSRGEVVDNAALLQALHTGKVRDAILDVWEGEPAVNRSLLQRVFIGTPHIAGYSADGKVNADNMVIAALCRHFHLPNPGMIVPPALTSLTKVKATSSITHPSPLTPLSFYNPMEDSEKLKANPSDFEFLRNNYPLRREQTV